MWALIIAIYYTYTDFSPRGRKSQSSTFSNRTKWPAPIYERTVGFKMIISLSRRGVVFIHHSRPRGLLSNVRHHSVQGWYLPWRRIVPQLALYRVGVGNGDRRRSNDVAHPHEDLVQVARLSQRRAPDADRVRDDASEICGGWCHFLCFGRF